MRVLENELKTRKILVENLMAYGFQKEADSYTYEQYLSDSNFKIIIKFINNKLISKVIDLSFNEEYILVDVPNASGEFVGKIKEEYESTLKDIIKKCSILDAFKSKTSKNVIQYVKEKYNDELEFLWKNSNDAVFRHSNNRKWYAILLFVKRSKLGFNDDTIIEVIDLKYPKEKIEEVIDSKTIFPGYHMNKKSWITIPLDGSVPIEMIYHYIDISYKI